MTERRMTTPARLVLAHLRSASGPVYGREISAATGIKSGTLYPLLRRLEAASWVVSRREDPAAAEGQRRPLRRYYKLTDQAPAVEQGEGDFDGCSSSACRPRNRPWRHTYEWGLCAHAPESARPEPRVTVMRPGTDDDGPYLAAESCTVTEMAERIERALRTVQVRFGPNALAILQGGGTVGLSGGEYAAMALAVAQMLATDTEENSRA